jgi:hypothetical protein
MPFPLITAMAALARDTHTSAPERLSNFVGQQHTKKIKGIFKNSKF